MYFYVAVARFGWKAVLINVFFLCSNAQFKYVTSQTITSIWSSLNSMCIICGLNMSLHQFLNRWGLILTIQIVHKKIIDNQCIFDVYFYMFTSSLSPLTRSPPRRSSPAGRHSFQNWTHFMYKMDNLFRSIGVSDENSSVTRTLHFLKLIWTPDIFWAGIMQHSKRRHQFPTCSESICYFSVTDLFRSELNDREIENHYKTNSENVEGIIISPA